MPETRQIAGPAARLLHLIDLFKAKTATGLARLAGVPRSTVDGAIRRNAISPQTAVMLAKALHIRAEWLQFGTGPIFERTPGLRDEPSGPFVPHPDPFRETPSPRRSPAESAAERFRELWRYSEIESFSGFAEACGVTTEDLQTVLDTDSIDELTARQVAARMGVSFEWIYRGKGPFQLRGAETEGLLGFETLTAAEYVKDAAQRAEISRPEFVAVPKANSRISAGGGIFPDESLADERYAFRADWLRSIGAVPGRVVLLQVEGDSMEPELKEGDTVLIDLNRTRFKEGRLFAIGIGDALFVKRLQMTTGKGGARIRVLSDNTRYHSFECAPDEIRLLGEVVWYGRSLV